MYKFFTYKHTTNFVNRRYFLYFNRKKSESSHNGETTIYSTRKKSEESKIKLFAKILDQRSEFRKEQIIKIYVKINPQSVLKAVHVDYLMKARVKKIDTPTQEDEISSIYFSDTAIVSEGETKSESAALNEVQRPKRRQPGKVIWGFVPKEWADFFIPVTGYSGFYTLLATLGTYLFSKEIYVCDHEYYNGLSLAILCVYVIKKKGPELAKYLDKEIDAYERELYNNLAKMKQDVKDSILSVIETQECVEEELILIQAKRENVHFQREAEFRRRQMEVYENVRRILDYHITVAEVMKKIQHKNLVQWVLREVEKNLTPDLKEEYLKLCIADIQKMLKGM